MIDSITYQPSSAGRLVTGSLGLIAGSVSLGTCLLALLSAPAPASREVPEPERVIERIAPKKVTRPKPKPQRRVQRRRVSTPKPNLSTDMSQLGSGIALFAIQGAELSMNDLLSESSQDGGDLVMSAETVDTLPKPLVNCQPRLTRSLIQSQRAGWVKVKLLINKAGELDDLQILESEPRGLYDQVVTEAMRECRWRPALYRGNPSALQTYKTFRFQRG